LPFGETQLSVESLHSRICSITIRLFRGEYVQIIFGHKHAHNHREKP